MHQPTQWAVSDVLPTTPADIAHDRHSLGIAMNMNSLRGQMYSCVLEEQFTITPLLVENAAIHAAHDFDAVLMDDLLFDKAKTISANVRRRTIIIAPSLTEEVIQHCAEINADGCIIEERSSIPEFQQTIRSAILGEWAYPPEARRRIMSLLVEKSRNIAMDALRQPCPLTCQEIALLRRIASEPGIPNKLLAKRMHLSIHTIKNHLHNIYAKLGIGSRHEAIDIARCSGWLNKPLT